MADLHNTRSSSSIKTPRSDALMFLPNTKKQVIDQLLQKANAAMLEKRYHSAYTSLNEALKLLSQNDALPHQSYYNHVVNSSISLVSIRLRMFENAKESLKKASEFNTDVNMIPQIMKEFPLSIVQEIAGSSSNLTPYARQIVDKIPPKKIKQPPTSHLQSLNALSENIYNGNPGMYINRAFKFQTIYEYKNATSDYHLSALMSPKSSAIWKKLSLMAIHSNQNDLAQNALKICQDLASPFHIANAELMLCINQLKETFKFYQMAKLDNDSTVDHFVGRLKFIYGDVQGALSSESKGNKPEDVDIMIKLVSSILTSKTLQLKIPDQPFYFAILKIILNGIFKSLNYSIREVPVDLWISKEAKKTWRNEFNREMIQENFLYPIGFNLENPQSDNVEPLIRKGYQLGQIISSYSINAREKAVSGLAYMQLVQSFKASKSYPLLNAIADVVHWLRLIDLVTPIFYRYDMFIIYLKQNEYITKLSNYYYRVLEHVKFDLAAKTIDAAMREKILNASSADQIYGILLQNAYTSLPNGASTFILRQENHSIIFGIFLPYHDKLLANGFAKLRPCWCKMMNMINQRAPEASIASFLLIALEWLYEYEKLVPLMFYSANVGVIIFAALITTYYGVEFESPFPDPMYIQMEAILSKDFTVFYDKMKELLDLKFKSVHSDIPELPDIVSCFPTYHHRIQGLLSLSNIENIFPEELYSLDVPMSNPNDPLFTSKSFS